MKLKKYSLLDELNKIDDRTIEQAINIDSVSKLADEKKKYREEKSTMRKFNFMPICASAVCVLALGAIVIKCTVNKNFNDERVQIASPINEVESTIEMKKYLGFDVPTINDENIEEYIVVGFDKYADLGRVLYDDGSEFKIAKKGYENISGIYGGTLTATEEIDGISVDFYTYENHKYAIWEDNDFTYSFISSEEGSDVKEFVSNMIAEIK